MIIKEINWDGYNEASIKHLNGDGTILCDLRNVSLDGGVEIVSKCDIDISFPESNYPFTLHEGEMAFLNGEIPTNEWLKDTIKLWLDEHGIMFPSAAMKAELLALVP